MNARGAMEMAMALVALQYEIISEQLFVALVVMALATSAMSGPLMKRLVGRRTRRLFLAHLAIRARSCRRCSARDRAEVIRGARAGDRAGRGHSTAACSPTPCSRARRSCRRASGRASRSRTRACRGSPRRSSRSALSSAGVDFGAPDGELARFVVLVVTPEHDDLIQLELLAEIARTFQDAETRRRVASARSFDELSRALRDAPVRAGPRVGEN